MLTKKSHSHTFSNQKTHLVWSKNSMERLMISSSVIILLSSSATSPRSSCEPLDASGEKTTTGTGYVTERKKNENY